MRGSKSWPRASVEYNTGKKEFIDLGSHFHDSRFRILRHLELILMPCWNDTLKLSGEAKMSLTKYWGIELEAKGCGHV